VVFLILTRSPACARSALCSSARESMLLNLGRLQPLSASQAKIARYAVLTYQQKSLRSVALDACLPYVSAFLFAFAGSKAVIFSHSYAQSTIRDLLSFL
jgi:hypothetical protein